MTATLQLGEAKTCLRDLLHSHGFTSRCCGWGPLTIAQAQQETMQFPAARDNSIIGWESHSGYGDPREYDKFLTTEEFANHGGRLEIRARKGIQHAVIMDWDTNEINAFLSANADPTQPMSWTLNVFPVEGPPQDITIETLESLNDWSEGDGDSFANFNWSRGTTASTTNYAQTAYEIDGDGDRVLDPDNSLPWIDNDDGTGRHQ